MAFLVSRLRWPDHSLGSNEGFEMMPRIEPSRGSMTTAAPDRAIRPPAAP